MGKKKDKHMKKMEKMFKEKNGKGSKKDKTYRTTDTSKIEKRIDKEVEPGGVLYKYFNFLVDIGIVYELRDAFLHIAWAHEIAIVDENFVLSVNSLDSEDTIKHVANNVYSSLKIPTRINSRDKIISRLTTLSNQLGMSLNFNDNYVKLIHDGEKYPIGIFFVNDSSKLLSIPNLTNIVIQKESDPDFNIIVSVENAESDKSSLLTNYKIPVDGKTYEGDPINVIADIFIDIMHGDTPQTI